MKSLLLRYRYSLDAAEKDACMAFDEKVAATTSTGDVAASIIQANGFAAQKNPNCSKIQVEGMQDFGDLVYRYNT